MLKLEYASCHGKIDGSRYDVHRTMFDDKWTLTVGGASHQLAKRMDAAPIIASFADCHPDRARIALSETDSEVWIGKIGDTKISLTKNRREGPWSLSYGPDGDRQFTTAPTRCEAGVFIADKTGVELNELFEGVSLRRYHDNQSPQVP